MVFINAKEFLVKSVTVNTLSRDDSQCKHNGVSEILFAFPELGCRCLIHAITKSNMKTELLGFLQAHKV